MTNMKAQSGHSLALNRSAPPTRSSNDRALDARDHSFPIKRLKLQADESRDIAVAYVPLLDQIDGEFLPQRAAQRYTCLTPDRRYRYEGLFRAFTAELEIDGTGLVLDYPDTFRRMKMAP